jgi:hypothetical protein
VNDNLTDTCTILDDPANGVSPTDGRRGVFNFGAQTQKVFTNRGAGIGGTGYRISSTPDSGDLGPPGGISIKQAGPINNGNFVTFDGYALGVLYRFNLTVSCLEPGTPRTFVVDTPQDRLRYYSVYHSLDSNSTTELTQSVEIDALNLTASWVPAPSALALLGLGALWSTRRRR